MTNVPIAIPLYHPTPIHPNIAAPHTPSTPPNTLPSTLPTPTEPLPIARQILIPTLTQLRDID